MTRHYCGLRPIMSSGMCPYSVSPTEKGVHDSRAGLRGLKIELRLERHCGVLHRRCEAVGWETAGFARGPKGLFAGGAGSVGVPRARNALAAARSAIGCKTSCAKHARTLQRRQHNFKITNPPHSPHRGTLNDLNHLGKFDGVGFCTPWAPTNNENLVRER